MYAPWLRAFGSAALHVPKARVATRAARPARPFHVSTRARAAGPPPPPTAPAPAPADKGNGGDGGGHVDGDASATKSPNPDPKGSEDSKDSKDSKDSEDSKDSKDTPRDGAQEDRVAGEAEKDEARRRYGAEKDQKSEPSEAPPGDENLFGEGGLGGNGDVQGRKQRRSNGLRARTARNRTPEELPPVMLPPGFRESHVRHFGDRRDHLHRHRLPGSRDQEHELEHQLARAIGAMSPGTAESPLQRICPTWDHRAWRSVTLAAFHIASWESYSVHRDCQRLSALVAADGFGMDAASLVLRRGNLVVGAARALLATTLKMSLASSDATSHNVEQGPDPEILNMVHVLGVDYVQLLLLLADRQTLEPQPSSLTPSISGPDLPLGCQTLRSLTLKVDDAMQYVLRRDCPFVPELGMAYNDLLAESVASVQSDFQMIHPKSARLMELRRPVTILNFPFYQGVTWPRRTVQDIAATLEADVIHLTANDIALVVGSYLGQEVTRAPGSISLLGYKAAEASGRIHSEAAEDVDDSGLPRLSFGLIVRGQVAKKDSKGRPSVLDQFLNGQPRDKSDEMWEDKKINAALEELLQTTDTETHERQRPLIVHLHDFNALNQDSESGSSIVGKIRKIIDTRWSEGRKIVLLGTCSSLHARSNYTQSLNLLCAAERVITFDMPPRTVEFFDTDRQIREDYLAENTENIANVLGPLVSSSEEGTTAFDFDLRRTPPSERPVYLTESVLSWTETHRFVKTMIGMFGSSVYDQAALDTAARLIKRIDEAKDRSAISKMSVGWGNAEELTGDNTNPLKKENHEEKLLSGVVNAKDIRTTFNDIHAPQVTIESIKMLTQLSLLRPEAFSYGVLAAERIPGCLLYGPPGTGKTLLAKAVAKESGANMIEISGASINNMYVGESEKNVRALFRLAKKKEPMVIFIDEADALLGARRGGNEQAGKRDTINQFLREWDGLESMKAFIMVATNRPFDLDEAVLRRLPRKLLIDLPVEQDRAAILRIHLRGEQLDDSVSFEAIAKDTPMYSGSDLKNVAVAAAMSAVKEEMDAEKRHAGPGPYKQAKRVLSKRHFDTALGEISASVNEDMQTMNAIKKFDEKYGDGSARRKKRPGMGFQVAPSVVHEAQVRPANKT